MNQLKFLGSIMFFLTIFLMDGPAQNTNKPVEEGYANKIYVNDKEKSKLKYPSFQKDHY